MNSIKPKVSLYGIRPEMVLVHGSVCAVFAKFGHDCIITSGVGKKHSKRSLHYVGYALDYRAKHISDNKMKRTILGQLQNNLPNCDIVLEHVDESQEHFHVEFDDHNDEEFQSDKLFYKTHGKWPSRK